MKNKKDDTPFNRAKNGFVSLGIHILYRYRKIRSELSRRLSKKMEIKVMTFNLRCACEDDGINHWRYRTGLVSEVIKNEHPDLIGFQEVTMEMLEDVRKMLESDYVVLGAGRNSDYTGEGVNIAYRKDKFDLLFFDTFWLSDTPNVPGSRFVKLDQSGCPRTAVVSRLAIRGSVKSIIFCNTHLDHEGEQARLAGAKLLVEKLGTVAGKSPIILTGDMNARPDSPSIAKFCDEKLGMSDFTKNVGSTFHKWGQKKDSVIKIDYIFSNATKSDKAAYRITDYERNGVFCSDHYPVCAFMKI